MLAAKALSKKKKIIYLVIIIVLAITGFFIYRSSARQYAGQYKKATQDIFIAPNPALAAPAQLDSAAIKRVLSHPLFKKLEKHGDWPVKVDALGRVNPFQPF